MSTADFNPIPSRDEVKTLSVQVTSSAPDDAEAIGVPVAQAGDIPDLLGKDRAALEALDFKGEAGQALRMPRPDGPTLVAIGVGDPDTIDAAKVRDAAAAFGRATARYTRLAVDLTRLTDMPADEAAQAVVEGVLLARYRYDVLKSEPPGDSFIRAHDRGRREQCRGSFCGRRTRADPGCCRRPRS